MEIVGLSLKTREQWRQRYNKLDNAELLAEKERLVKQGEKERRLTPNTERSQTLLCIQQKISMISNILVKRRSL